MANQHKMLSKSLVFLWCFLLLLSSVGNRDWRDAATYADDSDASVDRSDRQLANVE